MLPDVSKAMDAAARAAAVSPTTSEPGLLEDTLKDGLCIVISSGRPQ